ncbi:MAG: hypothetical protein MUC92_04575 [Fimbriimonadaceae bacterium]|jgi:hypothetical protein|nr:hypothetical protein [Fimbriimonadaceae bacterium]
MRVLVFEDDLIWSTRLRQSVRGHGHDVTMYTEIPHSIPPADVAILNLASEKMMNDKLIKKLKVQGTMVIGHAGHKESALLAKGSQAGCDLVVTNSMLTFQLGKVLTTF